MRFKHIIYFKFYTQALCPLLIPFTRNANQDPQFRSLESAQPITYWIETTLKIFRQNFTQNSPSLLTAAILIVNWWMVSR